ncbi:MAG: 30S ribosomal protein S12 methylthiotransferase RimO [Thermodesulfobacteriota bacterium]
MGRAFHLVSLGCPKNRVDSERIAFVMMESGFEPADDPGVADVIVVNSCSFVAPAVEESLDTILDLRNENPSAVLVVAGCMPLRYGEALADELPEVDLFLDPAGIAGLPRLVEAAALARAESSLTRAEPGVFHGPAAVSQPVIGRAVSTPGYAYLKVAEGCSRRCTYCTIPGITGPLRSMDPGILEREVESLAERGVREIVVVAQDVTAFGSDRGEKDGLVGLLHRIQRISGIDWIRLMYLHPAGISRELLELIRISEKVLPYMDVPFQHVSAKVLRAMGRPWRDDPVRRLVDRIRTEVPDVVLRTTVMVGFPGETAREFEELSAFVSQAGIEHVGVFEYSPEEDTPAARRGDPVPSDEKKARADEIRAIHARFSHRWHRARVGGIEEVLVEGVSGETDLLLQGRAWYQAPEADGVTYITAGTCVPGEIRLLQVTDSHGPDLFGEILTEATRTREVRK